MQLHELTPAPGSRKNRKRVGRGPGSGMGKTATRGHKGLKARAGGTVRPGFEGGQMPIHRRLPKRGFTNFFKKRFAVVNLKEMNRFEEGSVIDEQILRTAGLVKGCVDGVKILGTGDVKNRLIIKNLTVSESARGKIEAAGGSIE